MAETAPGKWRLRTFVGEALGGRVRHKNKTLAGTKREAQMELARLVAGVERGLSPSVTRAAHLTCSTAGRARLNLSAVRTRSRSTGGW
jgi:hypothetical protein